MMSSFAVQAVLHLLRLRKAGYFAVRWEVTWIAAPWTLHSAKASGVPRWIIRPGCGAVERPFSTVPVVTALYHRHWCQVAPSIGRPWTSTLRGLAVESRVSSASATEHHVRHSQIPPRHRSLSCCEAAGRRRRDQRERRKKKNRSPTERVPSPLCLAVSVSRPSGEVPCVRPCRVLPCAALPCRVPPCPCGICLEPARNSGRPTLAAPPLPLSPWQAQPSRGTRGGPLFFSLVPFLLFACSTAPAAAAAHGQTRRRRHHLDESSSIRTQAQGSLTCPPSLCLAP